MKEVLTWGALSGCLLLFFVVSLLIGVKRRKMAYVYAAVVSILLSMAAGIYAGYKFARKSYRAISEIFTPRTGSEIYTAMFGAPDQDCVQVLHQFDPVIPKIDCSMYLEFKTCPAEMERILRKHPGHVTKVKAAMVERPGQAPEWWKMESLGDSVLEYKWEDPETANGQYFFVSADSTHVFYYDIFD